MQVTRKGGLAAGSPAHLGANEMNTHVNVATDRSIWSKLIDLQDLLDQMRDLLILEWTVVQNSKDNEPWSNVSRNLNTANQAATEKLDAINELMTDTRAAYRLVAA
jgi:hypothetical protein